MATHAAGEQGRSEPMASTRLGTVTKSVGVHEAKTQLSRLLQQVAEGEEIEITNRGRVVARLVAPGRPSVNFGFDAGRIWVAEDFDAPLPDDLQTLFE